MCCLFSFLFIFLFLFFFFIFLLPKSIDIIPYGMSESVTYDLVLSYLDKLRYSNSYDCAPLVADLFFLFCWVRDFILSFSEEK